VIDHGNDVTPYTLRMGTAGTITTATVNPGDTTFAISVNGTGAGWVILAGTEYILINSSSGLTVTSCTRGYAGTVAGTYAAGQVITVTDPLHLNPTGEGVVAQAVHDKIVALGLLAGVLSGSAAGCDNVGSGAVALIGFVVSAFLIPATRLTKKHRRPVFVT
jgi:hypothetical protein